MPCKKMYIETSVEHFFFQILGLKGLKEKLYKSYISAFLWKSPFYKWINSLQIPYNKIS